MESTPSDRKTVTPISASFELAKVRCEAEAKLFANIEKNEGFWKRLLARSTDREHALIEGRLSLIKNSYRVEATLSPILHQLRDVLRATLHLVQPIDLYVEASSTLNAFCIPSRKGTRLVMCLNSALVNQLTPHELMFVMGHEAGHAILGHGRIPRIEFDDPDFSPLEVVRIRALGRRQEVSCDRVGLLACQSLAVAGSALLKIMSGLNERWISFDENALLRQFDQIADLAEVTHMDDAASTHPIIALRAKALKSFADSDLFAEAIPGSKGLTTRQDLEREMQHLLSVLEPDLSELENASEEAAGNSLLTNGALAIVAADGTMDPQEIAYLKSRMRLTAEIAAAMQQPNFPDLAMSAISDAAQILRHKLNLHSRVGLLHELCRVALSAGGYAEAEQTVLMKVGASLEIPEVVFRQVLSNTQAPEGPVDVPQQRPPRRRRKRAATGGGDQATAAVSGSQDGAKAA